MKRASEWHIVTSEYPPQIGGVSAYTRQVAEGLAGGGDTVHVWCPRNSSPPESSGGVTVHTDLGRLTPWDLRGVDEALNEFSPPRRLLVQWVPHGYGYRSMNMSFCLWLWTRARIRSDIVEIMVHEPFLAFGDGSRKQDAAAVVHRLMTIILLNAAERVWISIPAWRERLRPYFLGRQVPVGWLPIPSSIDCSSNSAFPRSLSSPSSELTLGHFGTFGRPISRMLLPIMESLLSGHPDRAFLLIGKSSAEFRAGFVKRRPELDGQVQATGEVSAAELSRAIGRCDLMIQPYPDGISSRRTSAMAGLCHGRPIVTTLGRLSENLWKEGDAVALVPVGDLAGFVEFAERLLVCPDERSCLGLRARRFYLEHFDLQRTIAALRSGVAPEPVSCAS